MKFSQRIGKTPIKMPLQVDSMDSDLRKRLWNTWLDNFLNLLDDQVFYYNEQPLSKVGILRNLWKDFLINPIDEIPTYTESFYEHINEDSVLDHFRKWYYSAEWYNVYDFIEFITEIDFEADTGFINSCNKAFQIEASGYRIINGKISKITSEEELREIEEALNETGKWKSVNKHLSSSLDLFSDRKNPDYRNSIKESISAVESLCKIITNKDDTTLGKALIEIESKFSLHPA